MIALEKQVEKMRKEINGLRRAFVAHHHSKMDGSAYA